jgi:hypothetical protein
VSAVSVISGLTRPHKNPPPLPPKKEIEKLNRKTIHKNKNNTPSKNEP